MKSILVSCLFCVLAATAFAAAEPRERLPFNQDWRFLKSDAPGAEARVFDDSTWRTVRLPHDWAIEGPFDLKFNPHTGGLPIYGTAWYRKSFTLPAKPAGTRYSIEFDGVMSNARVWLNGHELGGRPYGYIGFSFDLTPHLQPSNVLAVRVSPEPESSRWYPGAGIYRNVWLDITGPVHVARWGTYITTPEVSEDRATVNVKTEVRNDSLQPAELVLQSTVLDASGKKVSQGSAHMAIPVSGQEVATTVLAVARPQRWDLDRPYLYSLVTEVRQGKQVLDRHVTPLGIRAIAFDKSTGFSLNGRHLKMQGVCNHHDLGALGAAVSRRATERQLQIMKSMGVNAIRTSHNPPSPELLEYCDRLGLIVMDEAFDMWRRPKVKNGYSKYFDEWGETDLRDMLHRDRNHPSVVLWSIGNEIPEQSSPEGGKMAKRLTDICHAEDSTRPTTSAFNNPMDAIKNGLAAAVDVPGINYKPFLYSRILADHPDWILVGSETASVVSSRGVYHLPLEKYQKHPSHQISSYDIISPPWANLPDPELQSQEEHQNVLGEFVWTGFDYLGEPTPFFDRQGSEADWPARSSYFGIVDLAGFPKDRYYLYKSVWTTEPMVHILPHWNWAGREGQAIPVMAYTNADEVELYLDGRSLGRKKARMEPVELPVGPSISQTGKYSSKYRLLWNVPYQPGTLKAAAFKGGKQVAVDEIRTAGAPARVTLQPDRTTLRADGDDLSFVTVRIEDKDGNLCRLAGNEVKFKVEGAGRIAAVDNGNAATVESFQADHREAFSGLALLIIRSDSGKGGTIRVSGESDGLQSAQTTLRSK